MRRNKRNIKTEYIEILNSEGPILAAYRTGDNFLIVDEDQEQVNLFSEERMLDFIDGKFSVIDSRGRNWNYLNASEGMKTERDVLINFVSSKYKISRDELKPLFLEWMESNDRAFEWEEAFEAMCDLLESNSYLIRKKNGEV